jgi:hypothetical protein
MAVSGTPKGGRDDIAELAYRDGPDLTLVCYTNTADSLSADTTVGDLVQPTQANGYAPIVLDGTWSTTDGVVTYVHSVGTHPRWIATGTWSGTVTGVALIRGTRVRHFKDNLTPFVAAAAKVLEVNISTLTGP